jgi:uncharacterized membrane protein YdjX (TVP38/TMEM64 family)
MKSRWLLVVTRVLAMLFVVAISVFIFSIREQAQELEKYSYPGIFVLSVISYATVILPAPGVAVVFTMGAVFNPWIVALVAGAGAAIGELIGYLAGFSSQPVVERVNIYQRMVNWVEKYGSITILFFSVLPNPFFDLTGIAAGALKMPVKKFFLWTWLGETIKMFIFAFAGAYSLNNFFH